MDIDSIKEICSTFESITGQAKLLFIWWMVFQYSKAILFGVAWTIIGYKGITKLLGILHSFTIGERLRTSATDSCMWYESDIRKAEEILRKHMKGSV